MNRLGLNAFGVASIVCSFLAVILGLNLLPPRAQASEAGTFGPWLFTWMLIWMTAISGLVLGGYLFTSKGNGAH
jgi:hypothetical protein